jgi:hypothetical protein
LPALSFIIINQYDKIGCNFISFNGAEENGHGCKMPYVWHAASRGSYVLFQMCDHLTNPKMDIKRVIGEMKQANLDLANSLAEESWQILYTDNDGQVLLLQRG